MTVLGTSRTTALRFFALLSLTLLLIAARAQAGESLLVLDCQGISGIPKFLVKNDVNTYRFPQDRVFEQLAISLDGFKEFRTPYQVAAESQILAWSNESSEVKTDSNGSGNFRHSFESSEFATQTTFECQKMSAGYDTALCKVQRKVTLSSASADAALKPQEASGSCSIRRWKTCDYLADVKKTIDEHRESELRGPAHSSWKTGQDSNHILQLTRFLSLKHSCRDKELASEAF